MCLHAIGGRYQLQGVTDCISKVHDLEVARNAFTPGKVRIWTETLEEKWKRVKTIVEQNDPHYRAAMQILIAIGRSGHDDWKHWATQFSTSKGTVKFTVNELLDSVLQFNQHLQTQKLTEPVAALVHSASGASQICNTAGCSQ